MSVGSVRRGDKARFGGRKMRFSYTSQGLPADAFFLIYALMVATRMATRAPLCKG
jgi:hypothetical protein